MPATSDLDLFAKPARLARPNGAVRPNADAPSNWVAVACAEHVRRGHAGGFMQVCHGKTAPLRRIRRGDRVVYYSPTDQMGDRVPLQAFTAIGTVRDGEPYEFDMGDSFQPFRRDVAWAHSHDVPIRPLLQTLAFTSSDRNWGYKLRFGLFEIGARDLDIIAIAMGAGPALLKPSRPASPLFRTLPVDLSGQNHHL